MDTKWIVVANASNARIYSTTKANHSLNLIQELAHPESRKKGSELISDGAGYYKSGGTGGGNFSARANPKDVEADHFAKEIANVLENGRNSNDFQFLIIIAGPHFHGLLVNHFNHHLRKKIIKNIQKDYHAANERELLAILHSE